MHTVFEIALTVPFLAIVQGAFLSALNPCPDACHGTPENWTVYPSVNGISFCKEPILLDFSLYTPLDSPNTTARVRSCTPKSKDSSVDTSNKTSSSQTTFLANDPATAKGSSKVQPQDAYTLLSIIQRYLVEESNNRGGIIFGHSPGITIGVYSGESIDAAAVISNFSKEISNKEELGTSTFQLCGGNRTSRSTFGAVIDTSDNFGEAQKAVAAWNRATCTGDTGASAPTTLASDALTDYRLDNQTLSENRNGSESAASNHISSLLYAQEDDQPCRTIVVVPGDGCGSLADECHISSDDFMKYNPAPHLCAKLVPGQKVCCSPGIIPVPKQNPDGSCATYKVVANDTCAGIAAGNGITVDQINRWNDGIVWGWFDCPSLQIGQVMCISDGTQPMPAPLSNAVCGPLVPNTPAPSPITPETLSALNPCPLNACCDIWGQCGITAEYCTAEKGPKGNPGTAPPNKPGCISNCGTNITNNAQAPSSPIRVGYYESWNWDRPCLNMRAASIDTHKYSHVHWGFGLIGNDFSVSINDTFKQWGNFTALPNIKKILSFGGWGYSTSPDTYSILRSAMDPANAKTFASNIASFVSNNNLDGVDIDWEYPGAPDIPGIPPGLASDGPNYLNFLQVLRNTLPKSKTMSIAAPASYWYLKAFPIANMSSYLDYIVYMTYDLHGQWDYGNKYSQEGCEHGNCLRSHINSTETAYCLSMITKAGVSSNKIVVGVSSYGRSFGMSDPNCKGPDCTYTGTNTSSTAQQGDCTQTSGYISNYEINMIIDLNETGTAVNSYYDSASDSNILVYNSNWVSYMDDNTKSSRTNLYKSLNFAGTVDWALDLQFDRGDDGDPDDDQDGDPDAIGLEPCTDSYPTLEALDAATVPLHCSAQYTLDTLSQIFGSALANYTDMVKNGYDKKFKVYAQAISDGATDNIRNYVTSNGSYAWSCLVAEASFCCGTCSNTDHQMCKYCRHDTGDSCQKYCNPKFGCMRKRDYQQYWKWVNISEPCPPDYSQRGYGPGDLQHTQDYTQSIFWTLLPDKADQFYADLAINTGIPRNKTKLGNFDRGNACAPANHMGDGDNCWASGYDYGIVMPDGYAASDVSNPKDIVTKVLSLSNDLGPQISSVAQQLRLLAYVPNVADVVDAVAMPALMFVEAVKNMASVDETATKIDDEKRKAIILAFVGAILFFIPIVGEVAGAIEGLADIAAIISLLGDIGNIAFDTYSIVSDPKNSALAIMGLIFAPAALADIARVAKAAKIRRGMQDSEIAKLGEKIATGLSTIKKINGKCNAI